MPLTTTITDLPTAPSRQDPTTFSDRADAWVSSLDGFVTEANAVAGEMNAEAAAAAASAVSASDQVPLATAQADAAAASAVAADLSASIAEGASNFVGEWSAQTGALNVPASLAHNGRVWALINNLADVTTSEPGVTADWQDLSPPPRITLTASGAVSAGDAICLNTGGTVSVVSGQNGFNTTSNILTVSGSRGSSDCIWLGPPHNCWFVAEGASGTARRLVKITRSGTTLTRVDESESTNITDAYIRLIPRYNSSDQVIGILLAGVRSTDTLQLVYYSLSNGDATREQTTSYGGFDHAATIAIDYHRESDAVLLIGRDPSTSNGFFRKFVYSGNTLSQSTFSEFSYEPLGGQPFIVNRPNTNEWIGAIASGNNGSYGHLFEMTSNGALSVFTLGAEIPIAYGFRAVSIVYGEATNSYYVAYRVGTSETCHIFVARVTRGANNGEMRMHQPVPIGSSSDVNGIQMTWDNNNKNVIVSTTARGIEGISGGTWAAQNIFVLSHDDQGRLNMIGSYNFEANSVSGFTDLAVSAGYNADDDELLVVWERNQSEARCQTLTLPKTNANNTNFLGFAEGSAADAQPVDVTLAGGTNVEQTGLTAGQAYWLDREGNLVTFPTENTVGIAAGVALSSTELLVK